MTVPKKPTAAPDAIDAFISGRNEVAAGLLPPIKVRKKPVRMKEEVLRQTFVVNKSIVEKLEAYAFWNRRTKKQVLETALQQFFADKKIKPIPRQ